MSEHHDARMAAIWRSPQVARAFLEERSLLLPHRDEQLAIMLRVLRAAWGTDGWPARILDLGCGGGVLLAAALDAFPGAMGVGVDYSPPMLAHAVNLRSLLPGRIELVEADLAHPAWRASLGRSFDVVLSGFCIHHLPDVRKREVYAEVFALLSPGGVFFHAEHVASATPGLENLFNEAMVEHLYRSRSERGERVTLEQVRHDFLSRPDRAANVLSPLEEQLQWLRDLGFEAVDCYWKWWELALFGGGRPR